MANFEVHIPATDGNGFNVTLKVGAENWMSALKAGLQKLGEQGAISQNVMVDIQDDNSIHVTEPASGRVFRIRELTDAEAASAQVKRPSQIKPPPTRHEAKTVINVAAPQFTPAEKSKASDATVPGVPPAQLHAAPTAPPPRVGHKSSPRLEVSHVEELVQPVRAPSGTIGRPRSSPDVLKTQRQQTEEILADIFLRVADLSTIREVKAAMEFILDLVMEKIPCEAGSVLKSDGATGDLTFITARGPKAKEVLGANIVVPAGTGIAGFCASEGVSVAISDVQKDPRFYAEVGARVGYATQSMLSAPMMTHGHSFGCIQVMNRKGGPQFLEHEIGVIAYLAHQAALFLNQKLLE